jgi:exonuclease III
MTCLFWNCRGLRNPLTVQELTIMVRKKDPLVLFLSETKLEEKRLKVLRCKWNFSGKFVVPSRGQSGGLALFWSRDLSVSISSYSQHHIDAVLEFQSAEAWRFTGFYGAPNVGSKLVAWNILRTILPHHSLPWLCADDFNELLSGEEKWGRLPRPESQMNMFRQLVDDCGFIDLGFHGAPFTWWNNRDGRARVLERLDRCLATAEWLHRFPDCQVHHLQAVFSDHRPLCLDLIPQALVGRPRKKMFRFEEMWTMEASCEDTIREAWNVNFTGSAMSQVAEKIKTSRSRLWRWSRDHFGSVRTSIDTTMQKLQHEEDIDPAEQNVPLI